MRAIVRFLAVVCALVEIGVSGAAGLTASQRMLLFNGGTPSSLAYTCSYTAGKLCGGELFTATGLATQFDSTGKLTYRPNNLLTYSQAWSDAAWPKSGATVTGNQLIEDSSTGAHLLNRIDAAVSGGNAIFAVKASKGARTQMALQLGSGVAYFDLNAGTVLSGSNAGIIPQVDGSYLCYIYGTPSNNNTLIYIANGGTVSYTGDGSSGIWIYAAYASRVTYETAPRAQDLVATTTAAAYYGPRFDYTYNGSSWVPAGLLVEGAATNLHKYSGALATTFTASNITTAANAGTAPDGSNTFTKLIEVASTATHFVYDTTLAGGITSATATTISYYVKAGTRTTVGLNLQASANNYASVVFNLANGTASQTSTGGTSGTINGSGIQSIGGGIYRIWMSATVTGSSTPCLFLTNAATGNVFTTVGLVSYTATGEDFFVWGGQVETGSSATSLTPTGASSVTRAAETVPLTGAALAALQGASGTAIVEYQAQSTIQSGAARIIGTTSSRALLYGFSDTVVASWNGSRTLNATIGGSGKFSTIARTGASWSAAGTSLGANGGTVATDANAVFGGVSPSTAYLASDSGSTNFENGWYRSLAFYTSRLPDATLQAKSVVGASYAANDNGVRFAFANDNLPVHWRIAL